MSDTIPDIVFVDRPIDPDILRRLVVRHFEDMVKFVVDVEKGVAAVGGELHADEEALLPAHGNRSMRIEDPAIQARVREIAFAFIGRGEPLP